MRILRQEELTLSTIRQYYFVCESRWDKYRALCNIYGSITIGQAIIFCQTRKLAEWLSLAMTADGHRVAMLTAELTVEQRADVIQRFRDGKEKVLVTTNVCARGIDVKQVTIVVNFNLPGTWSKEPDFETYLHRIGRAGRFGKKGIAFNMVERRNLHLVRLIEEHFREWAGGGKSRFSNGKSRGRHRGSLFRRDGDQAVGPGRHGRAGEDRRVTPASESARIPRAVGKAGGVK
uniref:RNA helicase n=1 Tax=Nothoprocta perdicaria TaxID=30464 RepID=A0A8C6ZNC8_NOTPE